MEATIDTVQVPFKPYYDSGGITIYHADCKQVLPFIKADACISDPPWGVKNNNANQS